MHSKWLADWLPYPSSQKKPHFASRRANLSVYYVSFETVTLIGGTLGLLTGVSIISIVEVVFWVCKLVGTAIQGKLNREQKQISCEDDEIELKEATRAPTMNIEEMKMFMQEFMIDYVDKNKKRSLNKQDLEVEIQATDDANTKLP